MLLTNKLVLYLPLPLLKMMEYTHWYNGSKMVVLDVQLVLYPTLLFLGHVF